MITDGRHYLTITAVQPAEMAAATGFAGIDQRINQVG
jgi:hypothetical protein